MIPHLKLAEVLCTRLCHDLTGPIGAIANGTEFLTGEEGAKMQDMAIDLISSSAAQAVSRLQFYRRAYGRINDEGEANLESLRKLIQDFFLGTKTSLDWPDEHTHAAAFAISHKMSRILVNLIIISAATLLRGGIIMVRLEKSNDQKIIRITATGKTIKWDKEIEQALSEDMPVESLTPRIVQPYMTKLLIEEVRGEIRWKITDESAELCLCQPL